MLIKFIFMKKLCVFVSLIILSFCVNSTTYALYEREHEKSPFSDVFDNDYYFPAIYFMYERGILKGYKDGTFRPLQMVSRAEFVTATLKMQKLSSDNKNCFPDVKEQWHAKYICKAKEMGIIHGYSDGYFRPDNNINFAEAGKILVRSFDFDYEHFENEEWYNDYVMALSLRRSIPASFSELDHELLRGQMAEMLWRLKWGVVERTPNDYENIKNWEKFTDIKDRYIKSHSIEIRIGVDEKNTGREVVVAPTNSDWENAHQNLDKTVILYDFIENNNVSVETWENPQNNNINIIREIKAKASIKVQEFLSDIPEISNEYIHVDTHRGYVYAVLLNQQRYLIYSKMIDSASLEVLEGECSNYCAFDAILLKDKNGIYQFNEKGEITILEDFVDNESFQTFKRSYVDWNGVAHAKVQVTIGGKGVSFYKDKNSLYQYFKGKLKVLSDIDLKTFGHYTDFGPALPEVTYYFDKNYIYFIDENEGLVRLEGSDKKTFTQFNHNPALFEDKNYIYSYDYQTQNFKAIEDLDVNTFEPLIEDVDVFFRDKNNIFISDENYGFKKAEGLDIGTFVFYYDYNIFYAKDKNGIYNFDMDTREFVPLEGLNMDKLSMLYLPSADNYEIYLFLYDENDIWFYEEYKFVKIENTDPATFNFEEYVKNLQNGKI